MTVDDLPESIRAMADAIRVAADPQRIILFGSHARGEARAGSDVDLLVVQERERWAHASLYVEMSRLRAMIPQPCVPVDVLVFTPEEVEDYRTARNSVVARALADGVVLYERCRIRAADVKQSVARPANASRFSDSVDGRSTLDR